MLDAALALLGDIESAIVGVDCDITRTYVSAGEPADPLPGCTDIAVWVSDVQPRIDPNAKCMVRSRLTLTYRVGQCYADSENGPTEDDELAASTCLYDLMEAIWCGLVDERSAGTIAGTTGCDQSDLGVFAVDARGGGYVTATGTVTIDWECLPASS